MNSNPEELEKALEVLSRTNEFKTVIDFIVQEREYACLDLECCKEAIDAFKVAPVISTYSKLISLFKSYPKNK